MCHHARRAGQFDDFLDCGEGELAEDIGRLEDECARTADTEKVGLDIERHHPLETGYRLFGALFGPLRVQVWVVIIPIDVFDAAQRAGACDKDADDALVAHQRLHPFQSFGAFIHRFAPPLSAPSVRG